jgi:hypothetical protein
MGHLHGFEEGLALLERLLSLGPVVDRHLALENVDEDGHAMLVGHRLLARCKCHDHRVDMGLSGGGLGDLLAHHRSAAGESLIAG